MSTDFKPLIFPPGVSSTPTKTMQSRASNYAEVNAVRWTEGQLAPIGGQSKYNFTFASRCKAVHGWYDLAQVWNVAYLCEAHLYVDRGGVLLDISPTPPIVPPTPPSVGGYGDGAYNTGPPDTYGTPRTLGAEAAIDRVPDAFSLNNFGAILLAMTSADGRLLFWDPAGTPGTKAAVVVPASGSTVPHGRCFVVTPERFVQIFGSYNDGTAGTGSGGSFRRFAWCEQEDFTNWSYSDLTTQAGFIDIEPASPIITAIATRTGTLFWTAKKAYRSRFLGTPYVYNYDELGDNCTPWSPQSMVTTSSMVLWFSQQGPYSYDGTSILPVQCMVRAWIDDDIDLLQGARASVRGACRQLQRVLVVFPARPAKQSGGIQYPRGDLQLQGRLVGPGEHGALRRRHGVLYLAYHHGEWPRFLRARGRIHLLGLRASLDRDVRSQRQRRQADHRQATDA